MTSRISDAKDALFLKLSDQVRDSRVLDAMARVPRELFVPPELRSNAYSNAPLPIGYDQTISQPLMTAHMTSVLQPAPTDRVLEVGTGSGYQAAILGLLAHRGSVVTVERIPVLARHADELLRFLDLTNVQVVPAGTTLGCPEKAPFDAILVTAAAPQLPQSLLKQLAVGGRLVIPVGSRDSQELVLAMKTSEGISIKYKGPCRFVPLLGKEAWPAST